MSQNDVFQVGLVYDLFGESAANVYHLEQNSIGDPPLTTQYNNIQITFEMSWFGFIQPLLSSDVNFTCLKVQKIHPTREAAGYFPKNLTGGAASDSLPASMGLRESWYSDNTLPRGRGGHWYVGLPKSLVEDGRVVSNYLVGWGNLAGLWPAIWSAGGLDYQWGIWSSTFDEFNVVQKVVPRIIVRSFTNRRGRACI